MLLVLAGDRGYGADLRTKRVARPPGRLALQNARSGADQDRTTACGMNLDPTVTATEPRIERPGEMTPAPPGVGRRRRFALHWELFGCALAGHALVGTDVAAEAEGDDRLVRPGPEGSRWHRCLRCDAWVSIPVPQAPARDAFPAADEIELPLRGRALRDRYVLRLIACERLLHVAVFSIVGVVILVVAANRETLDEDFQLIVRDLRGGHGSIDGTGFVADIGRFITFSDSSLYLLAAAAFGYALLEAVEAVGLWLGKRWAEYLTFAATIVFVPFEILDLTRRVTVLSVLTLLINVAIVAYLLIAKRLFGLRGGHAAILAEHERDGGWDAVGRATPP